MTCTEDTNYILVVPCAPFGGGMGVQAYVSMQDLVAVTGIPEGTLRRWASENGWRTVTAAGRRRYRAADAYRSISARQQRQAA